MRIGVHCSVRNGFVAALQEAAALKCETLQIFTQSPRGWRTRVYTDREFEEFRRERERLGLHPVVVHAPYLPNLCTSERGLYDRSLRALKEDLRRCEQLGADSLVIHPGAYSPSASRKDGLDQLVRALNECLSEIKGKTKVLLENMAGGGRRIGDRFEEIGLILNRVGTASRIGVCFDTCHAVGAGYDLTSASGVSETLEQFDKLVGLSAIEVVHVNDSRAPRGSHRDLHEHIGKGEIGSANFRRILSNSFFRRSTLILETPKDSTMADLNNIRAVRGFLKN